MPVRKSKGSLSSLSSMDQDKLLELALQNRSKRSAFTFQEMLREMNAEEMDAMWENLSQMITKQYETLSRNNTDSNRQSPKKLYVEISNVIQAVIDIGQVMLSESMPVPKGFLHVVVFLNGILFNFPNSMENFRNNISCLCEKMFYLNYVERSELFTHNAVIYLLKRSSNQKAAKKDVKRTYALRSLIPKVIAMENVDSNEVWELLKKCSASPLYTSMPEGQKIISLALTIDADHVSDIHNVIKKKLSSCTLTQASFYGKVYFEAWSHAVKTKSERLQNILEITCIQDLVLLAICDRRKSKVLSLQKVLAQFHCKKKETDVLKMLYSLYQPILWRYLKDPDGLIRANAAQLFLDVFPLENPDLDVVTSDQELNEQMLMIKDLLVDDYPIVRCSAIVGLCLAMSVHWELFPEEMLKTYFKILTDDLGRDSSSSDVRCAVAKGFKGLLENPLTVPTLQGILPRLKNLFDDISNTVRIAFCQLLLSVKRVWGIKYYDIVPLKHLLARMEEDPAVCKLIVNLIHNSYFPRGEHPNTWLFRCVEMIKTNKDASKEFFHYIPRYIGIDTGAKFMVQAVKAVHFYIRSKSDVSLNKSSKKKDTSLSDSILGEAVGFHNPDVVSGLLDAVAILWLSCNLAKPENKTQLKMVVANLTKWMEELILYYEDTPVWSSVYYLASLMPPENVPSLADLCHKRLKSVNDNGQERDYRTLLQCLCNQREGDSLLMTLKEWIAFEFSRPHVKKPTAKRRKIGENNSISTKPLLGLQLLNDLLNERPCQKIVTVLHAEKLKSFLELYDVLKLKIESLPEAKINASEANFIIDLLLAMTKIAVLLHEKENFNGIKLVEDIVMWVQDNLCKQVWPDNSMNSITRRSSSFNRVKCSSTFEKLVTDISKDLCGILADMTYLGFFNTKKFKFMKFGINLLNLDLGASVLLEVSKLLLRHTWSGAFLYSSKKQDNALQIVPDCFNKIKVCISDKDFTSSIPSTVLKEIQLNLSESGKLMNKYNNASFRLSYAEPSLTIEPPEPE